MLYPSLVFHKYRFQAISSMFGDTPLVRWIEPVARARKGISWKRNATRPCIAHVQLPIDSSAMGPAMRRRCQDLQIRNLLESATGQRGLCRPAVGALMLKRQRSQHTARSDLKQRKLALFGQAIERA